MSIIQLNVVCTIFNFSSRCIESSEIADSNLTQKMKRHTMLVALSANHCDSEIVSFSNVARWTEGRAEMQIKLCHL